MQNPVWSCRDWHPTNGARSVYLVESRFAADVQTLRFVDHFVDAGTGFSQADLFGPAHYEGAFVRTLETGRTPGFHLYHFGPHAPGGPLILTDVDRSIAAVNKAAAKGKTRLHTWHQTIGARDVGDENLRVGQPFMVHTGDHSAWPWQSKGTIVDVQAMRARERHPIVTTAPFLWDRVGGDPQRIRTTAEQTAKALSETNVTDVDLAAHVHPMSFWYRSGEN